ncbi:MAG: amidohydrolase family protein [Bryobacteraceae bacterium]|nr:amidohydrolase family protein [Bryobacteraceae bacterium]
MIGSAWIARRTVLGGLGALGAAWGGEGTTPLPAGVKVIDAHDHLFHHSRRDWQEADRSMIEAADILGIDQLCCSILPPERPTRLESFRECNKWLLEAMGRFPGRILGYCFVNPGYTKEALEEVRRYVEDHGFIGVKLYNDYRADEPVVRPLVELTIRLGVPILHHGGHTSWLDTPQPRISDGSHMAALAGQYPEATLIHAHIGGGGDWEWTVKSLRHAKNVYLDLSGSVIDEGTVEMAARVLGVRRLLFACDLSMTASVGRIRGADLSEEDKRLILGDNMRGILDRRRAA